MAIELNSTNASAIASALLSERRKAGSPTMGMVMTLLVIMDEGDHYDALRVARAVSREHPARIIGIIRRAATGKAEIDAELSVGASGESVLLRLKGEVTKHAESVVLPLLLPDSPVVAWWPTKAPANPAEDPLGQLASRRITDSAAAERGRAQAILAQARVYADGNTDLAWTRLTPWRALLAAALDQYPARISEGCVTAEKMNPSADLLVAWLCDRLRVPISRQLSKGPGVTSVVLETGGGPIEISRPDGLLAQFSIPNAANRPVALKRRDTPELLAEELRRLDPDDVYAATVKRLTMIADGNPLGRAPSTLRVRPLRNTASLEAASKAADSASTAETSARSLSGRARPSTSKSTSKASGSKKSSAGSKKSTTTKSTARKGAAKKASASTSAGPSAKKSASKKTAGKKSASKKSSSRMSTARGGS
jgi:glucose-6-phosphate dehydrogenase assembly protein OpcA